MLTPTQRRAAIINNLHAQLLDVTARRERMREAWLEAAGNLQTARGALASVCQVQAIMPKAEGFWCVFCLSTAAEAEAVEHAAGCAWTGAVATLRND